MGARRDTPFVAEHPSAGGKLGRRSFLKGAAALGVGLGAAALNPGAGSLAGLLAPRPVGAGNPAKLIFFYRAGDGLAAVCSIDGGDLIFLGSWAPGAFSPNWTHIVGRTQGGGEMLFYTHRDRASVRARLDWTNFQMIAPANFGLPFWTHVVPVPPNSGKAPYFFYNSANREGVYGLDPIVAPGSLHFDRFTLPFWTHLTTVRPNPFLAGNHHILGYRASNGAGQIGVDPVMTVLPPGFFTFNWTHVVANCRRTFETNTPYGTNPHDILFYNQNSGLYAVARLSADQRSIVTVAWGYFSTWTHITPAGDDGFLFYNATYGSGAIGRMVGNSFVFTRSYPSGFAFGWTHIVDVDRFTS